MPYVTSVERLARREGQAEGKADTLVQVLELRYAVKVPADLETALRATTDLAQLERWVALALQTDSLEDFRRLAQV